MLFKTRYIYYVCVCVHVEVRITNTVIADQETTE